MFDEVEKQWMRGRSRTVADSLVDQLNDDIYLIDKGVRNCALHTASSYKLDDVIKFLEFACKSNVSGKFICKFALFEEVNDEIDEEDKDYKLFLYRYPHQVAIFERCLQMKDPLLYEWTLGKLLGYSDESIEGFLQHIRKTRGGENSD